MARILIASPKPHHPSTLPTLLLAGCNPRVQDGLRESCYLLGCCCLQLLSFLHVSMRLQLQVFFAIRIPHCCCRAFDISCGVPYAKGFCLFAGLRFLDVSAHIPRFISEPHQRKCKEDSKGAEVPPCVLPATSGSSGPGLINGNGLGGILVLLSPQTKTQMRVAQGLFSRPNSLSWQCSAGRSGFRPSHFLDWGVQASGRNC